MTYENFTFDIAQRLNVSEKQADAIIKTIADTILGIVQERQDVPIPGFGRFLARTVKAHSAKVPANHPAENGEPQSVHYAERSRIGFRAFRTLLLRPLQDREKKTA